MIDLIPLFQETWKTRGEDVLNTAEQITVILQNTASSAGGGELDKSVMDMAYSQLSERYDFKFGGFGKAPKFPTPHNLLFLLDTGRRMMTHGSGNGGKNSFIYEARRSL